MEILPSPQDAPVSVLATTVEMAPEYQSPVELDPISAEDETLGQSGLYQDSGYPSGKHS